MTKQLLNEKEAAEYIGMSVSYLRVARVTALEKRSPAPKFIKIGRAVRYPVDELISFVANSHRLETTKLTTTGE